MKYCISVLLFISMVSGCRRGPELKLSELKLGGYERKIFAENKIDTVFFISKNVSLTNGESDTIGYWVLDSLGNLRVDWQKMWGGRLITYDYDSNGMIIYRREQTDYVTESRATYKFFPSKMMLFQYWVGKPTDACYFKFDEQGKLMEENGWANDNPTTWHYRTFYERNAIGDIVSRKIILEAPWQITAFEKRHKTTIFDRDETLFYYTDGHLDSTIEALHYPSDPKRNLTTKTFYDAKSFRVETVAMDSLVVRYAYKRRSN